MHGAPDQRETITLLACGSWSSDGLPSAAVEPADLPAFCFMRFLSMPRMYELWQDTAFATSVNLLESWLVTSSSMLTIFLHSSRFVLEGRGRLFPVWGRWQKVQFRPFKHPPLV
mmetsp:Transcript_5897/g.18262  ORF Transcript_5897/g.18262 Transcript_5897/m.18262 type:complete len:114 (-) Transcript_5897:76-417(-)